MNDRSNKILSQVRLRLGQTSTDDLKNKQIYNIADYIQTDIMLNTECVEKEFTVYTKAQVESYSFADEETLLIKSYETSWNGNLVYKSQSFWNELPTTGGYPVYYSIFDRKIYFRPFPQRDDDIITIKAYQTKTIIRMDDDIEPEIPSYADRCLIFGICSEFLPDRFLQMYLELRNQVAINAHNKIGVPLEGNINW